MIIQYQEQGIFFDWIQRDELKETLEKRLDKAESLFLNGSADDIAQFMGYTVGLATNREYWLNILQVRIDSLKNRLSKLT